MQEDTQLLVQSPGPLAHLHGRSLVKRCSYDLLALCLMVLSSLLSLVCLTRYLSLVLTHLLF